MASNGRTIGRTVALATLCLLAVALAGGVNAQPAATQVDSCTTIDDPGRYVLTANVTNDSADVCINIQSDGVRFDGDGNAVVGNGSATGVAVGGGVSNVTVRNVTVTDWAQGVRTADAEGVTANGVTARGNDDGVVYADASNVTLTDSTAAGNADDGVVVNSSSDTTVENNAILDNGDDGVDIDESDGVVVSGNALSGNAGLAVEVTNSTDIRIRSTTTATDEPV